MLLLSSLMVLLVGLWSTKHDTTDEKKFTSSDFGNYFDPAVAHADTPHYFADGSDGDLAADGGYDAGDGRDGEDGCC